MDELWGLHFRFLALYGREFHPDSRYSGVARGTRGVSACLLYCVAIYPYIMIVVARLDSSLAPSLAVQVIDPMYYPESLGRIPKMVVLSSDDEFMQVISGLF